MKNHELSGKYFIIKDIKFSDFMKNDKGELCLYDTAQQAADVCGIYEFNDAIVCEIKYIHKETRPWSDY